MKSIIKSLFFSIGVIGSMICCPIFSHASDHGYDVRPTYSMEQIYDSTWQKGVITFNSIVLEDSDYEWYMSTHDGKTIPEGTLRNETNFVGARSADEDSNGAQNVWEGDKIAVEDGKTYIIRIYVHNNNPYGEEEGNIAKNTQVRFYVPEVSSKSLTVNGWLKADNAREQDGYVDDVTFYSNDTAFHLEYVSGSALLKNGNYAKGTGVKLTDHIVNQGNPANNVDDEWTRIGYHGLDGDVPGGYQYINYVSIEVRAFFDYDYTVEKKVRIVGDTDRTWQDSVEAQIGDIVEFQIEYTNTSEQTQTDVSIRDILSSNFRYISNSAKIYNACHPGGAVFTSDALVDNGINIGSYTPGSNAIIRFQAEIVNDDLYHGTNTLLSWGRAGVNTKTIQDYASVTVKKDAGLVKIIIAVIIMFILICLVIICILLYKIHRYEQLYRR